MHTQAPPCRLYPVAHARQAVRRHLHAGRVKARTVVVHLHRHMVGMCVHRHQHLVRVGVLADVGQCLLHHAVHRELRGAGQLDRLQVGLDLDTGTLRKLAGENLERSREPQVRQGGRSQVLDDAALEGDAAVERVGEVLEAFGHIRRIHIQLGFQARHIQLGGGEQCTQFVVQLAGQVAALVFPHLLQVACQLRQGRRALAHQAFQAVALVLKQGLFALAHHLQGVGLAQVHEERQQANRRDHGNANAREHERLHDLRLADLDLGRGALDERMGVLADFIHVLPPHVGVQDELPGVFIALPAQSQAQLHLCELARDLARQQRHHQHVVLGVHKLVAQGVHVALQRRHGFVVGLQVDVVARQQVTALAGLSIEHALQQAADRATGGLPLAHLAHRVLRAHVPDFVDAHQNQGGQQSHGQAQRHATNFW